jgi:hypothetical protein
MSPRALLLAAALAVSGCSPSLKTCSADGECGAGAHCVEQVCTLDVPKSCGTMTCTSSQRCTAELTCVADQPPALTLDSPQNGASITAALLEVSGTATDDAAPPLVELSTDGTSWSAISVTDGGAFTASITLPQLDGAPFALVVRARDNLAHETKLSRTLQVDDVPPSCAFMSPPPGSTLKGTSFQLVMTAADGSGNLVNARVSTDQGISFTPVQLSGGSYSYTWSYGAENGVMHGLVFRVEDGAGHTCESARSAVVDTVPPVIAFSSPDAGSLLGPAFFAAGGLLAGTASDGAGTVTVGVDFGDDAGLRNAVVQGGGWSVSVPKPAGEDYRAHVVTATATDTVGNMATATLTVTVDVMAPVLAITSPAANAKLNIASFPAGDDVAITWTVSDGDPRAPAVNLSDGGTKVTTSASDNPTAYQPQLTATDRAGNAATAQVTFTVDRVAPSVTSFTPSDGTRMYAGPASVDFSEPMIPAAALVSAPAVTGAWTTASHFQLAGLAKDTVYLVTPGAVTDVHGNPAALGAARRFHTETWTPDAGATLVTDYEVVIEATADQEGVLDLLLHRNDGGFDWVQLDPSTGAPTVLTRFSDAEQPSMVATWRTVSSDLKSHRLGGVSFLEGALRLIAVHREFDGGSAVEIIQGNAFIPTPAFVGEGTGLAPWGVISGSTYQRGGRADLPLAFTPERLRFSSNHWEISKKQTNGNGDDSQSFGCYHQFVDVCDLSAVSTLSAYDTGLLAAISNKCSVHIDGNVFGNTITFVPWQPQCTMSCPGNTTQASNYLREAVADLTTDGVIYGKPDSPEQIRKAVLSGACTGTWSDIGAPIAIPMGVRTPHLVVLRGVPGMVWLDLNGDVKFSMP